VHVTRRTRSKHSLSSPNQVEQLLRVLPDHAAFYFYTDVNRPTEKVAKSLIEWVKIVGEESPQMAISRIFHMNRGDFARWIKHVIGDHQLADQISEIDPEDSWLAKKLDKVIDKRVSQLRESLVKQSIITDGNSKQIHNRKNIKFKS
jgi:hypothetical protein